jgi:NMT1/THI5 like protein
MSKFSRRRFVTGGLAFAGGALLRPPPARAAPKLRVLTNWFAEAEHGGFYQALATGLYEKAGIEVELRQGNAQLNGMQLLLGGEADIIMTYDRVHGNTVIDKLEGTPSPERNLEIARHPLVGAGVAADDRGKAHNRNAHVLIFPSIRRTAARHRP